MRVHHIGYVVKNIQRYKRNLAVQDVIKRVYDKTQNATLELIKCDNIYIELIEPDNTNAFTYDFLQKGGGYHHLCYELSSKKEADDYIKKLKMIKVLDFVFAPLLEAEVVFAYNRNKEIVEFVICPKI